MLAKNGEVRSGCYAHDMFSASSTGQDISGGVYDRLLYEERETEPGDEK